MYSSFMDSVSSPSRCRLCGTATYRRLTHRGSDGAMQYSGLYRCSGCPVTFSDPVAWREGPSTQGPGTETGASTPAAVEVDEPINPPSSAFETWGYSPPLAPGEPVPYDWGEADTKVIQDAAARANKSKGRRR